MYLVWCRIVLCVHNIHITQQETMKSKHVAKRKASVLLTSQTNTTTTTTMHDAPTSSMYNVEMSSPHQKVQTSFLLAKQAQQKQVTSPTVKQHRMEQLRTQNRNLHMQKPAAILHVHDNGTVASKSVQSNGSAASSNATSAQSKRSLPSMLVAVNQPMAHQHDAELSNLNGNIDTGMSSVTNPSNATNGKLPNGAAGIEFPVYERRVRDITKKQIFSKLKFITSDTMLQYDTNNKSLCQLVCTLMHITDPETQKWFWSDKQINRLVSKTLRKKRSDATTCLKKGFMGKLWCN